MFRRGSESKAAPLALLVIGLVLLSDPVFGWSRGLPDGLFELVAGIALSSVSYLLYRTEQRSEEI